MLPAVLRADQLGIGGGFQFLDNGLKINEVSYVGIINLSAHTNVKV